MVKFLKKLKGAKARAFAAICLKYMESAEQACTDVPLNVPLFGWLSPYQRVALVREVMIGLLCENEPLPPPTIHHYATFCAIIETMLTEVEVEIDFQAENPDVPSDLWVDDFVAREYSAEEFEDRSFKLKLVRLRAEKYKGKLDRKGYDTANVQDVKVAEHFPRNHFNDIFVPLPNSLSQFPPLDRELTLDEERVFRWRLFCVDALVEANVFPTLQTLAFDFRSNNWPRWSRAIIFAFHIQADVQVERIENQIATFPIDELSYADKTQHPRIKFVKRSVLELRSEYDSSWNPNTLSEDQRCVYSIGASVWYSTYVPHQFHQQFIQGLMDKLIEKNVSFEVIGNYQERFEAYKKIRSSYPEGLDMRMGAHSPINARFDACETPSDYAPFADDVNGMQLCAGPCNKSPEEEMKLCSKCRVVVYCSRECQVAHWPNHKVVCNEMTKLRKDKAAMTEIVRSL